MFSLCVGTTGRRKLNRRPAVADPVHRASGNVPRLYWPQSPEARRPPPNECPASAAVSTGRWGALMVRDVR